MKDEMVHARLPEAPAVDAQDAPTIWAWPYGLASGADGLWTTTNPGLADARRYVEASAFEWLATDYEVDDLEVVRAMVARLRGCGATLANATDPHRKTAGKAAGELAILALDAADTVASMANVIIAQRIASSPEPDPPCTDCGGTGVSYQTERPCACVPAANKGEEILKDIIAEQVREIRDLRVALAGLKRAVPALENLRDCQRQLDIDGVEVGVSRQAANEVVAAAMAALGPSTADIDGERA